VIRIVITQRKDGVWTAQVPAVLDVVMEGPTAGIAVMRAYKHVIKVVEQDFATAEVRAQALDHNATRGLYARTRPSIKEEILEYIRANPGSTCDGVEVALAVHHATAGARIRELVQEEKLIIIARRSGRARSGHPVAQYRTAD
jgi:predicted transcriptional regulator